MDIYNNGKRLPINSDMRDYYGDNMFKIFYNGDLIYSKCQYKYNNWYYYLYIFGIEQKNDKIECELIFYGPRQPCECRLKKGSANVLFADIIGANCHMQKPPTKQFRCARKASLGLRQIALC